MSRKLLFLLIAVVAFSAKSIAQQPRYTKKRFVDYDDPKEFVRVVPEKNGLLRTYLLISPEIWDLDDEQSTYVKGGQQALVCLEGQRKNGRREGIYTAYLLDSADHKKRYKIWEQTYAGDKLNGQWKTYTLKGGLVRFQTYKNDSLDGPARDYWIDGKSIIEERIYFNGKNKYVHRDFSRDGKVLEETTFENGIPNGPAKKFYPNGILMDEVILVNGIPDGPRKYYYPSGKLWVESEMKNGKPWTVFANYTEAGQKRDPGTLKDGNGSMIFYNNNGGIRETVTYKNGIAVGQ